MYKGHLAESQVDSTLYRLSVVTELFKYAVANFTVT